MSDSPNKSFKNFSITKQKFEKNCPYLFKIFSDDIPKYVNMLKLIKMGIDNQETHPFILKNECKIAIFNSMTDSEFKPGSVITLENNEKIEFNENNFRQGILGFFMI